MEKKCVCIVVAGGTGSGKTTLAEEIVRMLGKDQCCRICHDFYYDPNSPHVQVGNFDHPDSFDNTLMMTHVRELMAGVPVETPRWDYTTHQREPKRIRVEPKSFIIVEGILVLTIPELVKMSQCKIYVDTPGAVRVIRRMTRDIKERGRDFDSVVDQWLKTVEPMHEDFCHPSRRHADIIVPHGGNNQLAKVFIQAGLERLRELGFVIPQ